jgi:hypothetical protein
MNAAIKRHWDEVLQLGCAVTRTPYVPDREGPYRVTLHHAHGGSMRARGFTRTFGRKTSDWLVVPLIQVIHTGPGGIDGDPRPPVEEWERRFGRQVDMLDMVCEKLRRNVWELALNEERGMVPRRTFIR